MITTNLTREMLAHIRAKTSNRSTDDWLPSVEEQRGKRRPIEAKTHRSAKWKVARAFKSGSGKHS
jgi:hypothetical protein